MTKWPMSASPARPIPDRLVHPGVVAVGGDQALGADDACGAVAGDDRRGHAPVLLLEAGHLEAVVQIGMSWDSARSRRTDSVMFFGQRSPVVALWGSGVVLSGSTVSVRPSSSPASVVVYTMGSQNSGGMPRRRTSSTAAKAAEARPCVA